MAAGSNSVKRSPINQPFPSNYLFVNLKNNQHIINIILTGYNSLLTIICIVKDQQKELSFHMLMLIFVYFFAAGTCLMIKRSLCY